jgi:hypothetical protein
MSKRRTCFSKFKRGCCQPQQPPRQSTPAPPPLDAGLRFSSFTTLGNNCFSIFNDQAIDIFNGIPDVSGVVQFVNENYDDFGVFQNDDISIMIDGQFYAETTGNYTFIFYDSNNLPNDDLSYFYIGENALQPSLLNIDKIVTYQTNYEDAIFTIALTAGTFNPIVMFFGQSGGGKILALGVVFPNSSEIIYNNLPFFH